MLVTAERLVSRERTKPMETMGTFSLRWKLTGINHVGQGMQCGCFLGRSFSTTGPVRLEGHNGESCEDELWFELVTLGKKGVGLIPVPTAWIRPVCANGGPGSIVTVFLNHP